ncbi:F0F1 ATP synthase subunit epsilon [Thiomicrorhabdus sp. zzn3]|uniref:F0F1 ATP synthase subunit epsilon n=1 Tax=Thiomicrorhabdus sp. zzn3 TaxID=3039775 RepID=UPI0024364583|nr:F0F1 ATP synthase subunit epsilon [Thiomicrorhabdus sp. zzn3]MDG6778812.1 F0F1 ATP synthase subunit epsilon [Thiomicrorhabdus sp. zzn3]
MSFALHIHDTEHSQAFEEVTSFVGEDPSGHFGVLSGHARFMTSLIMGLARFKQTDGEWTYLATSGALLYFENNQLTVSTRHFVIDRDYTRISEILQRQIVEEELLLAQQKQSLRRMEEAVLRRLWELNRKPT